METHQIEDAEQAALTIDTASQKADSETFTDQKARLEDASTAKVRKVKDRQRIKAERARPRIMIIIACLAYLATALLAINIGLLNISNFIEPRLALAESETQAESFGIVRERMRLIRLEKLLAGQLSRMSMESHEECLARGLQAAHKIHDGFQYADVRNQTMDWVMENCGRLLYTPQVADPSLQQTVLAHLTHTSNRGRQIAEEAVSFVKQKAHWILHRLFSTDLAQDDSARIEYVQAHDQFPKSSNNPLPRIQMPFGFDLACEDYSPCRLIYPHKSTNPYSKPTFTIVKFRASAHKFAELSIVKARLDTLRAAFDMLVFVLVLAYGCLIVIYIRVKAFKPAQIILPATSLEEGQSILSIIMLLISREDKYLFGSLALEVVSSLLYCSTLYASRTGGKLSMIWGLFMSMVGLSMMASFLVPSSQLEDIFMISKSAKELWLIMQDREIPGSASKEKKVTRGTRPNTETALNQIKKDSLSTGVQPERLLPLSYETTSRSISPTTVKQENIQAEELQALYEERSIENSDSEFGTDSEIDSEDSDDLAGRFATTSNDLESGWSVVDP
ncbi:uncharacterized protein K460DRAFT_415758 [Cucurbitaria berberidis CBS 394.84]|uniref:Uncharacterized protein n=1 Tax=Cucurbitaria berberidis CBS 394.84 TaxID=1168544 RepID=A0A9P4LBT4_9PLEO|nr:uncharacterized protein K460DRAFT_415758 [Cucurbitaria berberidis CBS 394.84]KAF1849380.1 hypothetical protein K460DRAFT_415758 [Cucurbitaria berberidis CBS 394.84]